MLILQIIPFMFIVAIVKGPHHGPKEWCVLVPSDLQRSYTILTRSCDDLSSHMISFTWKYWLTDRSVVKKRQIWLALVNRELEILTRINPVYNNVSFDNELNNLHKQLGLVIRKFLTSENARKSNNSLILTVHVLPAIQILKNKA